MKIKLQFLALFVFLAIEGVFARAGGGSSGGGSFGGGFGGGSYHYRIGRYSGLNRPWTHLDYVIFYWLLAGSAIFLLLLFFGYKIVKRYRELKTSKILLKSQQEDFYWNRTQLSVFVRDCFLEMQKAWMERDMKLVDKIATESLQDFYQAILNRQLNSGIYNFIDNIQITNIEIVGVSDYKDNTFDEFTAYISGKMVDEMMRENYVPTINHGSQIFEDLYHFVRMDGMWKLNEITGDINTATILGLDCYKDE